ncbi:MAG: ATPase [Chloroflexi bacterium HGW-Chloroflexi-3]|nr:MAG: ATPase [Chloroflexi bacterium HGW-Chloroflexi-3]
MTIFERPIFKEIAKALSDSRIIVITGMHRVGKTTAVRWLMDQISTNNKLFMDLERLDQRAVFEEQNYDLALNYFRNQGLDPSKSMTIALDDIQYVPSLPSVIKYLYDRYGIKFILTGSSSFYLKNYFSESMAGRKIIYEMFPLSFGEFLNFKGIPYYRRHSFSEMLFDKHEYERLKAHYDEFIKYGGLPNVVLEPNPEVKREILNDIFSSYINIDVQSLADFRKIGELQQLLQILAIRMGNRIDYSKLSLIVGISRPTLNEYLEFLKKTYIIYQLPAYSSVDKSVSLGKKFYFRDNGIASILAHPGEGALYENAIFNQLRDYGELAYLSKGKEFEIDFILNAENIEETALEVMYHPVETDENKLQKIAKKYKFRNCWVVGRYPTPEFEKFVWGGSIF